MCHRWRQHQSNPLPLNCLRCQRTHPSIMRSSLLHCYSCVCLGVYVCVCVSVWVCVVLLCWGVEGLSGQLQSYFRGPLGLFTTDPSVTDNHLPPMSIAHKCLRSSSLRSHQSSSALIMYSVWGLAADVAYTQQEKQHTCTEDKTCFFNSNKTAKRSRYGYIPFHRPWCNFMCHSHDSRES